MKIDTKTLNNALDIWTELTLKFVYVHNLVTRKYTNGVHDNCNRQLTRKVKLVEDKMDSKCFLYQRKPLTNWFLKNVGNCFKICINCEINWNLYFTGFDGLLQSFKHL